jgi:hypothetical protein
VDLGRVEDYERNGQIPKGHSIHSPQLSGDPLIFDFLGLKTDYFLAKQTCLFVGIITLSDILRYVIGHIDIPEAMGFKDDADEEQKAKPFAKRSDHRRYY